MPIFLFYESKFNVQYLPMLVVLLNLFFPQLFGKYILKFCIDFKIRLLMC